MLETGLSELSVTLVISRDGLVDILGNFLLELFVVNGVGVGVLIVLGDGT